MCDISDNDAKLKFLQSANAYGTVKQEIECIETHMSWVFLVGEQVFKLKKSLRLPYLDFTSLRAREFYCREELRLNARLAPDIYMDLMAVQHCAKGYALVPESRLIAGAKIVDWLVRMRRLPVSHMLHRLIAEGRVNRQHIDALVGVLSKFYAKADRIHVTSDEFLERIKHSITAIRAVLLLPQFELNNATFAVDRLDAVFKQGEGLLQDRVLNRKIVDGHGDLRPEHVCLLQPPVVIDCIEFNPQLREVDPFDEIAFLSLECEMLGAGWIGPYFTHSCMRLFNDYPSPALLHLYTAHKAMLRARFAMAHLLDLHPRTPEKWPSIAQRYISRALVAMDDFSASMSSNSN